MHNAINCSATLITKCKVKVIVKVKFTLEQGKKAQRGSRFIATFIAKFPLILALDEGGLSTSRPDRFTSGKEPVTFTRGFVSPRAC